MTDITALDKLIAAVEGGIASEKDFVILGCPNGMTWGWYAYNGSLDAAKALHDALLPGWGWLNGNNGSACVISPDHILAMGIKGSANRVDTTPARAWLIAILKAYRSMM